MQTKTTSFRTMFWITAGLLLLSTIALGRLTAQERSVDDEEPAAATEQPSTGARPSVDYQASEQISEDLSVSFPIDI